MSTQGRVIVIGAGWAGIAAAADLSAAGVPVSLFDAARRAGGRARSIELHGHTVDNGQHIGIGAYTAVFDLARMLSLDTSKLFLRMPLTLVMRDRGGVRFSLRVPRLPYPFNLAAAFTRVRGLGPRDLIALAYGLRHLRSAPDTDCTVEAFLAMHRQTTRLNDYLWRPLCTAALNTPPGIASACMFARVLDACFSPTPGASDLLLPASDLGALLPDPALARLQDGGAELRLGHRVTAVSVKDGTVDGVYTDGTLHPASQVIVAVPPDAAARLLAPHDRDAAAGAERFAYQPIATVYLRYPADVRLEPVIQGFLGTTVQWLIDRRITGTPGVMAAVVSADGGHTRMDSDALGALITEELAACFPAWPSPSRTSVVREKHATFSAVSGIDAHRPGARTAVAGLWLAGDWTATGLPSTLEGAVRSGFDAAAYAKAVA